MAKPRITLEVSEKGGASGVVQLFLNKEGRDFLLKQLGALSENNDHFHLFAPEWGESDEPLSLKPYEDGAATAGHLKVMFRPDEWDKKHYPKLFEVEGMEK